MEWRGGGEGVQTPPECPDAQVTLVIAEANGSTEVTLWSDPSRISRVHLRQIANGLATLATRLVGVPARWASAERPQESDGTATSSFLIGPAQDLAVLPVHRQFEQRVARHPNRLALASRDRTVTFGELDRRSNALAHLLVGKGARPNHPVAIVMDRSVDQVVAVLAVLKAGAPHLCVNPDQPQARISAQLEHAGSDIVLTVSSLAGNQPTFSGVLLDVDTMEDLADAAPRVDTGLDDLAYVIYTSGSTGTPKGVAVTHRNLANYVAFVEGMLAPDHEDGLTFGLVASLSTDLGNTCFYPALVTGGLLDLVPLDTAMDPEAFALHNAGKQIDILKITPSHLDTLLTAGAGVLPRVALITGGEGCTWDIVDRVRTMSQVRMINHYGPSECTVGSLVYEVDMARPHHRERPIVPIGSPIANTRVIVADERLRPALPGEVGELLIGGAGVACGYWRRPTISPPKPS